ncbi:MAG: methyltransferase domain-containing protein [Pseudomonadota bacterium]
MDEYYNSAFAPIQTDVLDYSADNRVAFIKSLVPTRTNIDIAEIGSGDNRAVKLALEPICNSYVDAEINADCNSDLSSIEQMPHSSADIVASYFVLEHVADPAAFLKTCRDVVRKDGFVIVEVPDLYLYGGNPAALRWWEHTNHFSAHTLARLAARVGLKLVTLTHALCSRSFGFVAAFKPCETNQVLDVSHNQTEVLLAQSFVRQGLNGIDRYNRQLDIAREHILNASAPVVWVANSIAHDLLATIPKEGLTIIDRDPKKRDYIEGATVHDPKDAEDKIRQCDLLVISSPTHAQAIQANFEQIRQGKLPGDRVIILSVIA